jgi:cytochrome c peroxidase
MDTIFLQGFLTMRIKVYLLSLSLFALLIVTIWTLAGCQPNERSQTSVTPNSVDQSLQTIIDNNYLEPLHPPPPAPAAVFKLGQSLFFDKELSGNRDVSCATCHHPLLASTDHLPLSIGVGGVGLGAERRLGPQKPLVARNAPDLFNRGQPEWRTMFWDSRVELGADGQIMARSSQGPIELPPGLENVVSAQALFPPSARSEMRGFKGDPMRDSPGDVDIFGQENELAKYYNNDILAIWDGILQRILAIPEYIDLLHEAYPDTPVDEIGPQHLANAIGAFEIDAYTFANSPWDRYLAGDLGAISPDAKQGAVLFYGSAGCSACHHGALFTDQLPHNIAVPQIGPGKQPATEHRDYGRFLISRQDVDIFAFRTPPLRNVTLTGPWMHNGAYNDLEAVIRHHMDPAAALQTYNVMPLPPEVRQRTWISEGVNQAMLERLDPLLQPVGSLSDQEVQQLLAFLDALTDPAAQDLSHTMPDRVPSGLPVSDDEAVMAQFLHDKSFVSHP